MAQGRKPEDGTPVFMDEERQQHQRAKTGARKQQKTALPEDEIEEARNEEYGDNYGDNMEVHTPADTLEKKRAKEQHENKKQNERQQREKEKRCKNARELIQDALAMVGAPEEGPMLYDRHGNRVVGLRVASTASVLTARALAVNCMIGTCLNRTGRFERAVFYGPTIAECTNQMSMHFHHDMHGNIQSVYNILAIKHKQLVCVYLSYTIIQMRGSTAVAKLYRTIARSVPYDDQELSLVNVIIDTIYEELTGKAQHFVKAQQQTFYEESCETDDETPLGGGGAAAGSEDRTTRSRRARREESRQRVDRAAETGIGVEKGGLLRVETRC